MNSREKKKASGSEWIEWMFGMNDKKFENFLLFCVYSNSSMERNQFLWISFWIFILGTKKKNNFNQKIVHQLDKWGGGLRCKSNMNQILFICIEIHMNWLRCDLSYGIFFSPFISTLSMLFVIFVLLLLLWANNASKSHNKILFYISVRKVFIFLFALFYFAIKWWWW